MSTYFITGRKPTSAYHLRIEKQEHLRGGNQNNNPINKPQYEENLKNRIAQPNGTKSLPVLGSLEEKVRQYLLYHLVFVIFGTTTFSGVQDQPEQVVQQVAQAKICPYKHSGDYAEHERGNQRPQWRGGQHQQDG